MKRFRILSFLFLGFLFFPSARAADSGACEGYFRQWRAAGDHPGLTNSAFGLDYNKYGSLFLVQRDGLPYYAPFWKIGVFTHSYSPVTLGEGGTLSPSPGGFGSFNKGEELILAGFDETGSEFRFKLLSQKKFSIKPGDNKETDRVSLTLVVPKTGNLCSLQKAFEGWLRGFGGMMELEHFQGGGTPTPPPMPPPAAPPAKKTKESVVKEPPVKEEKPKTKEAAVPEPSPAAPPSPPPPAQAPSGSKKKVDPTSAEALYPPQETNLKSGMSREEVDAKLGKPHKVLQAGDKAICYYDDVIVEFMKGRLSDIRLSDAPSTEVLKRFH
ncbi:MAG: hypothetical protein U1F57_09130 [bacterium]